MLPKPRFFRARVQAQPAAPAPLTTSFMSCGRFPTIRSAFSVAARTTTAVPCWSSWKTGMSSCSWSSASIRKHRGAEMSSRLMPPKVGRHRLADRDDLVRVLGVETQGKGVDAAELLEQDRLALHHRHGRQGADVAEPEDRAAVRDHRHAVPADRQRVRGLRLVGDRLTHPGHPGRVGHGEVRPGLERHLRVDLELAPQVHPEGVVGDRLELQVREAAEGVDDPLRVGAARSTPRCSPGCFAPPGPGPGRWPRSRRPARRSSRRSSRSSPGARG